jgi:hypothetical protein
MCRVATSVQVVSAGMRAGPLRGLLLTHAPHVALHRLRVARSVQENLPLASWRTQLGERSTHVPTGDTFVRAISSASSERFHSSVQVAYSTAVIGPARGRTKACGSAPRDAQTLSHPAAGFSIYSGLSPSPRSGEAGQGSPGHRRRLWGGPPGVGDGSACYLLVSRRSFSFKFARGCVGHSHSRVGWLCVWRVSTSRWRSATRPSTPPKLMSQSTMACLLRPTTRESMCFVSAGKLRAASAAIPRTLATDADCRLAFD